MIKWGAVQIVPPKPGDKYLPKDPCRSDGHHLRSAVGSFSTVIFSLTAALDPKKHGWLHRCPYFLYIKKETVLSLLVSEGLNAAGKGGV